MSTRSTRTVLSGVTLFFKKKKKTGLNENLPRPTTFEERRRLLEDRTEGTRLDNTEKDFDQGERMTHEKGLNRIGKP